MTKSDEIGILRAINAVGLFWAPVEINFGSKILQQGIRALLSVKPTSMGNQKFQSVYNSVLIADLKSAEKTVN